MKSDLGIKQDVNDELFWEFVVDVVGIGVEVENGVVILIGYVCSYMEKFVVEYVVECVGGVCGVVQKIEVCLLGVYIDVDVV